MRRLSSLLLIGLFLASAPTADAQLRGLLNRARDAVTDRSADAREAAAATAGDARAALDTPPRPADGAPMPALDFVSLLDTRFYPTAGQFGIGEAFLLFPPPGLVEREEIQGAFVIRDASGNVVVHTTIGRAEPTGATAIAKLKGRAGVVSDVNRPVEAGKRYTFDVELYGDVVGSMPFTVSQSSNGDPYNPVTAMALEGPWRTHAYFEHEAERPDYRMHFHAWISPDEMPPNTIAEVSVRRGGREVAWGARHAQLQYGWGHTEFVLYTPDSRGTQYGQANANRTLWTIQDVTPGEYEVVIRSEAGPFRTFAVQGGDGAFAAHPRSALDYEPRKHFLGTRRLSGQNLNRAHALYWIAPDAP
ncbi:hypothetical protein [Rubrivirga sp. IMCC45206]|uniref:hypothetical protein n=1 Tax=Rubrivirga sp. IMCC45206 TaxID=3391614 RepID=UPI0039901341